MGLITQTIDSFVGGVSQQPDILRFPNQVQELINGYPNEVEGLQKRPPLVHIKRLRDELATNNKFYYINRDDNEQYVVAIDDTGTIRIWDKSGTEHSCTYESDEVKAYVTTSNPKNDLKLLTVADYTFIVNSKQKVGDVTGTSPLGLSSSSLVYVKGVNYGKTFAIYIDDQFACGVYTPDGTDANDASQTTCAYVAQKLYGMLTGDTYTPNPSAGEGGDTYEGLLNRANTQNGEMVYAKSTTFDFSKYSYSFHGDSLICITKINGERPKVVCKDGFGNINMLAFMGACASTSKLPPIAPNEYIMKVSGETNSEDDYYVKWVDSKGLWQECCKPGLAYQMPQKTLPVALVRQSDGTFKVQWNTWVDRGVGDDDTNAKPSFIGSYINDVFFYRNRLGFITDEEVILSASNDFFNFWFNSATTIIDTDPIDVTVSSNRVLKLTCAIPFNKELMLFSKEEQFVVSSEGVMSPKSVKCDQVTAFDYNENVKPITIGSNIFFINDKTKYSALMRYYTREETDGLKDAFDCTAHVPTYLPKDVVAISGNTTESTILVVNNSDTIYCFKFLIQNNQVFQQAWFKWKYGGGDCRVVLAEWVGSTVYVVINSGKGLFLEKATITGNTQDFEDEPNYRLFMDYKVEYTIPSDSKYSSYYGETTVSFKNIYDTVPTEGLKYLIVTTEGNLYVIDSWDKTTGNFKIPFDARGVKVYVGQSFEFNTQLSKLYIKQQTSSGGYKSILDGRLQLRYFWFNFSNSGVFNCVVDNSIKNKHYKYTFTGRILNESLTKLGINKVYTGKFKIPIQENVEEVSLSLVSDNAQPLNIISAGYEGLFVKRG